MNLAASCTNSENSRRPDSVQVDYVNYNGRVAKRERTLTVLIHLIDQLLEDLLVEGLAHQPQNVGDHVARNAARLLAVEAVERLLQDYQKKSRCII